MAFELTALTAAMIAYDQGDPMRIHHFLKVHAFARLIGLQEGLDPAAQLTLEAAALVHDIGIHKAEQKHGSSAGKWQELEGPPEARALLQGLGCPPDMTERICFLVGHHHTYDQIDGPDYQILVEADFLVNIYEDHLQVLPERVFKTASGLALYRQLYG